MDAEVPAADVLPSAQRASDKRAAVKPEPVRLTKYTTVVIKVTAVSPADQMAFVGRCKTFDADRTLRFTFASTMATVSLPVTSPVSALAVWQGIDDVLELAVSVAVVSSVGVLGAAWKPAPALASVRVCKPNLNRTQTLGSSLDTAYLTFSFSAL